MILPVRGNKFAMEEKKESLTSLGDIIKDLMSGSDLPFNPEDVNIWKVWNEVVGPSVSNHARPCRILKKKLMVEVTEPIWLQELEYARESIRDKLNKILGRNAVDRIDFRLRRG